jgi:peptidoglycan/LPS O-acetylase OafA/YrhL
VTLGEALRGRDNALNFVRLLLAVGVVVAHSWPLGGFGPTPRLGSMGLGGLGVAGFFAISGYLIPASRQTSSLGTFAKRRAFRIFPGMWVCLVIIGVGFAPLAASMAGVAYDYGAVRHFFLVNASSVYMVPGIGSELAHNPVPNNWNGSLWTLSFEVLCYVIAGCAVRRGSEPLGNLVGAALIGTIGILGAGTLFAVLAYFSVGWILWIVRERVPASWGLVLVGIAATLASAFFFAPLPVTAISVGLLVLTLGAVCPIRWGSTWDLSYGVYIYAFPVQQILVVMGVHYLGLLTYLGAVLALTFPLAWASWMAIEAPALRLARRASRTATETDPGPVEHELDPARADTVRSEYFGRGSTPRPVKTVLGEEGGQAAVGQDLLPGA